MAAAGGPQRGVLHLQLVLERVHEAAYEALVLEQHADLVVGQVDDEHVRAGADGRVHRLARPDHAQGVGQRGREEEGVRDGAEEDVHVGAPPGAGGGGGRGRAELYKQLTSPRNTIWSRGVKSP